MGFKKRNERNDGPFLVSPAELAVVLLAKASLLSDDVATVVDDLPPRGRDVGYFPSSWVTLWQLLRTNFVRLSGPGHSSPARLHAEHCGHFSSH